MAPFWQMTNTKVELMGPLNNSMEAAFGQAALKLLESGDDKSLDELMELYGQARDIMKKLDRLVNE